MVNQVSRAPKNESGISQDEEIVDTPFSQRISNRRLPHRATQGRGGRGHARTGSVSTRSQTAFTDDGDDYPKAHNINDSLSSAKRISSSTRHFAPATKHARDRWRNDLWAIRFIPSAADTLEAAKAESGGM